MNLKFWKKQNKVEKRNYTDILISNYLASASGSPALASNASSIEIAAGMLSRAFSAAEIKGTDFLTIDMLGKIGRDLISHGESIWALLEGEYVRVVNYNVSGGFNSKSWVYDLTFPTPSKTSKTYSLKSENVLHIKYSTDVQRPWKGVPPWQYSLSLFELVSNLEKSMSQEAGGTIGNLIPIPKDGGDETLKLLRDSIGKIQGKTILVESTRSLSEGNTHPRSDWRQERLGHNFPTSTAGLYLQSLKASLGVLGISYDLVQGAGSDQREAYRRFLHLTCKPLAKITENEIKTKRV